MYIDYTGTIYGSILGLEPNSDVDEVYKTVKEEFQSQFHLTVLDALGFNNTYTLAIDKDFLTNVNFHGKKGLLVRIAKIISNSI